MTERWVLNASPLISLGRLGYGSRSARLAAEVAVPEAVVAEVLAGPRDEAYRLVAAGRCGPAVPSPVHPEVAAWDPGPGEAAVLSFAIEHQGWTAILDDGAARRCARAFGVPVEGTPAVVILARQQGLTNSAAEVLRGLQANGFRLDEATIREAPKPTVGEPWP